MAKFGESFLQQLGRPGWSQGMFGLGSAIGGAQGQIRDQRKKQELNQLMQQGQKAMASGDAAALANISQQLASAGYQKEAQQFMQASTKAQEKTRLQGILSGVDLQTPEGLGTLTEYYKGQGNVAQAVELATQQRELEKQRNNLT
jgi:hypothetical protein